jgi:mannan endo-1,4-beta-mannosidase
MKKFYILFLLPVSIFLAQCGTTSQFANFITTKKDKLMDGNKELRFVSYDIPNLHYIEDYFPFKSSDPWRLPTEFEIRDALKTIKIDGGKVARIYVLSVRRSGESKHIIRYVLGPGKFNEKAFRTLDKVLQIANEERVRLIIPFVDNWWWWGGPKEYAAFRGKPAEDFWTDPQLISDFEKTIKFVIERRNTFTGVLYKNDKAILGWETGNEIEGPKSWQDTIAHYIKSLDKNHLVMPGTNNPLLTEAAVNDTNFDVLSTHHYGNPENSLKDIVINKKLTEGKKPYFVGEFGLVPAPAIEAIVDTAISNDLSGIMIWSLRFHNRNGGFYQHEENTGAGSYRFPGFKSGQIYDEKTVVNFMRKKAFEINGEKEPPLPIPDPPTLLPVKDVYDISWQGSAGASSYKIQREEEGRDDWSTIADSVSDAAVSYGPLFSDSTAQLGRSYYYKIFAENSSGVSEPSNVVGPVAVNFKEFIDQYMDTTKIYQVNSNLELLKYQDIYKAKEDDNRLKGEAGSFIIYRVPDDMDSVEVRVFLTKSQCGLTLLAADSLNNFVPLGAKMETFPQYINYYGFFTPAIYSCAEFPEHTKYLKILFNDEAELSKMKIIYSEIQPENPDIITVK